MAQVGCAENGEFIRDSGALEILSYTVESLKARGGREGPETDCL